MECNLATVNLANLVTATIKAKSNIRWLCMCNDIMTCAKTYNFFLNDGYYRFLQM